MVQLGIANSSVKQTKTTDVLFKRNLTLPVLCKIKIYQNVFLDISLWCRKRFYEGLYGFYKTFGGTAKKCENKYLS